MAQAIECQPVIQQLGRTYRAFLSAYEKEVGHFLPRWRVMLHLYRHETPSPQKQVGKASFMDPGALSRQLKALEALGWIRRDTDPDDKRITNVSLTAQGRREVEAALPRRIAFMRSTLRDFSEAQLQQLRDMLLLMETRFTEKGRQSSQKKKTAA